MRKKNVLLKTQFTEICAIKVKINRNEIKQVFNSHMAGSEMVLGQLLELELRYCDDSFGRSQRLC